MNWNKPKVKVKEPANSWLLFLAGRETAWIKEQYGMDSALRHVQGNNGLRPTLNGMTMERKRHRRYGSQLPQLAAWLH